MDANNKRRKLVLKTYENGAQMNIDVLNLEWTSTPSRDREVATMVCNYLRFQWLSLN